MALQGSSNILFVAFIALLVLIGHNDHALSSFIERSDEFNSCYGYQSPIVRSGRNVANKGFPQL